jgi:Ca2+-binding RTX toxin-like protein
MSTNTLAGGDDTLIATAAAGNGNATNALNGGDGDDTLIATATTEYGNATNALNGGDGDDTLIAVAAAGNGSAATDILIGGDGIDTADYMRAHQGVAVDLAAGIAAQGATTDHLESIENVVGSTYGDVLIGDAGDNRLAQATRETTHSSTAMAATC